MRHSLPAAIVIAIGLVLAAVLNGGLYDIRTPKDPAIFMWRVNKLTGATYFCSSVEGTEVEATKGCIRLRDYDASEVQRRADIAATRQLLKNLDSAANPQERARILHDNGITEDEVRTLRAKLNSHADSAATR
jgi:hypothetical protein